MLMQMRILNGNFNVTTNLAWVQQDCKKYLYNFNFKCVCNIKLNAISHFRAVPVLPAQTVVLADNQLWADLYLSLIHI